MIGLIGLIVGDMPKPIMSSQARQSEKVGQTLHFLGKMSGFRNLICAFFE